MPEHRFNWTRFWCPQGLNYLLGDDGFLSDPLAEQENSLNSKLVPFGEIKDFPCLVLLGEPGIGKSDAIFQAFQDLEKIPGEQRVFVNLGDYGDERNLVESVFGNTEFIQWLSNGETLELFLDSLDECRLQISHVCKILRREFAKHKSSIDRLKLRITCRTSDWPSLFEESLKPLWKDQVSIFHAAPLRRVDVEVAARSVADPNDFMAEIFRLSAQPLAIRPITLKFLLSVFDKLGTLPATQSELYEQGCTMLASETNPDRVSAKQLGKLTASQRLAVASRIAAATTFSKRPTVRIPFAVEPASGDHLALSDIVGGNETAESGNFLISEEVVEEVLGSGLFRGVGAGVVVFAHQTYSEFLAARFLCNCQIKLNQKLNLLQETDYGRGRVYPQLAEVAVWLAAMDSEVFRVILRDDPKVLLRTDANILTEEWRSELSQRLLERYAVDAINEDPWEDFELYPKLKHKELPSQLKPVIEDRTSAESARLFAIHLANVNGITQLMGTLVEIASDSTESDRIRYPAIRAVIDLGSDDEKQLLKPIAMLRAKTEFEFSIKGRVLCCLWPKCISAEELFSVLDLPRPNENGSYRGFLQFELLKYLKVSDLPIALRWAGSVNSQRLDRVTLIVVAQISELGWTNFDDPTVQSAYLAFAIDRTRNHASLFGKAVDDEASIGFEDDARRRRTIAKHIVENMGDFESHASVLTYLGPALVRTDDMEWLINSLLNESTDVVSERWVTLIDLLFHSSSFEMQEAVRNACEQSVHLRKRFQRHFELTSDQIRKMQERFAQQEQRSRESQSLKNPLPLDPPPSVRVLEAVIKSESGLSEAWIDVVDELSLEGNSTHYPIIVGHDVRGLPEWRSADAAMQIRILQSAKRFVMDTANLKDKDWLGTPSTPYWVFYAFQAFSLLHKEAPAELTSLPPIIWGAWAPVIVSMLDFVNVQDDASVNPLAIICTKVAEEASLQSVRQLILARDKSSNLFLVPPIIAIAWDSQMEDMVVELAQKEMVLPATLGKLLGVCLLCRSNYAKEIAKSKIVLPLAFEGKAREYAVHAAVALFEHAEDGGWDAVWPAIQSDASFGKSVVQGVAINNRMNPSIVDRVSEHEAANLYIWMVEQYGFTSHREIPVTDSEPTEGALEYRDSILRAIQGKGTRAGIAALLSIVSRFPEKTWLKRTFNSAVEIAMRNLWSALEPREFLELTKTTDRFLVQNATHLQELIIESLERLQQKLQGENPATEDLWNADEPKDENCLSDYVVRHLRDDLKASGIVALREVEIRRSQLGKPGERTDLYVTGNVVDSINNSSSSVRVIIEVKCTWHPELTTAMKTQLVDRYLKANDCRHGIYLVGWYEGSRWNRSTSKYTKSKKFCLSEISSMVHEQAMTISSDSMANIRSFVLNVGT